LWLTVLFAFLSSAGGYGLAAVMDGSIAGAIVTCAGILFALVWGIQVALRGRQAKELDPIA